LPVNQYGERIQDRDINLLTVITNESYKEYLETLQTEYKEEVGENAPPVGDKRERKKVKIKNEVIQGDLFKDLWQRVSPKAKYIVNIDGSKFIEQCIKEIQQIEIREPEIAINKVRMDNIKPDEITKEFIRETSEKIVINSVVNLITSIERETNLTKRTIFKILEGAKNLNLVFLNDQRYAEKVIEVIKNNKKIFEFDGIKYTDLGEYYNVSLLKDEVASYSSYVLEVQKSIYDGIIKESNIEEEFAKSLDGDSRIKLFIKLPDWYTIETPAGSYTPDWAIVVERVQNEKKEQQIYFVVETKGTEDISGLRQDEKIKITSAGKRFELIKDLKYIAPVKDFDSFEKQW